MKYISFGQSINRALHDSMIADENVLVFGLGATDPKRIFGTTAGLVEKFGASRVFDTPTSENGMTGIGIGMAISGFRPVMCHQRLDFFLLAMDQLVNSAAKWNYMFGGTQNVPITIRLVVGRGWGQGPTHSQSLQSWFAHVPGLKVLMPSNAKDAYLMLMDAIEDPNPVVMIEHRWLYNSQSPLNSLSEKIYGGITCQTIRKGSDITIISYSYMCAEALKASKLLSVVGISCEVIDMRSIAPIDWQSIIKSVRKTGRLLALDSSHETCSISSEIIARISIDLFKILKSSPIRLALPNCPEPTSYGLTSSYYYGFKEITYAILKSFEAGNDAFVQLKTLLNDHGNAHHDVPGEWFNGPF